MYVLIPLGIISTALSSSFQEGIMKRWKVFLVVLAVTIVYVIVHFLTEYMKAPTPMTAQRGQQQPYPNVDHQDNFNNGSANDFFQCNQGFRIWQNWLYGTHGSPYNMTRLLSLELDIAIQYELSDPKLWATLGT